MTRKLKKLLKDFDISSFNYSGGMGGGEAGVPDDLLTTKGDTHGFDTANARVPIGVDTTVLTADSTTALGLAWTAPTDIAPPTTTKGDLSGFSTLQARIPIGINAQVLTADSTEALGLKWAATSGAELGTLTTATTVTPTAQTGTIAVEIDATNLTVGNLDINVDGVATNVAATTKLSRVFNPSTSLSLVSNGINFDMNNATYTQQLNTTPSQAYAGCQKSDGTVVYELGGGYIREFKMTTGWDISTATQTGTTLSTGITGSGGGITLSDDGTLLTIIPTEGGSMQQWTFSTPWDITTSTGVVSESNPLGTGLVRGMRWIDSGNKLLVNRDNNYETHSASTPYDITTLSDDANDFSTSAQSGSKRGGIDISTDGTIIICGTQTLGLCYKYDLSTAWDISTSVFASQTLDYSAQTTTGTYYCLGGFSDSTIIIGNVYDRMYEYDIPDSFTGSVGYKVV